MSTYSVRTIIRLNFPAYEERVTVWNADSFREAIEKAEVEADHYARNFGDDCEYLGLAQSYIVDEGPIAVPEGLEVFSLIRRSDLEPEEYLSRFFDTGSEVDHSSE